MRRKIIWCVFAVALAGTAVRLELRNRVPWNSVLQIELSGEMDEQRPVSAASLIPTIPASDVITLAELTRAIDAARDDRRVGALVVRINEVDASPAKLEEIATHIVAFRKSGKPTICFLNDEDDHGRANAIAAVCGQRLGEKASSDDTVEDFFNQNFGEDNWSPIELRDYLKRVRNGS
jgi:uncharacterized protein YecE (DUF72 family)